MIKSWEYTKEYNFLKKSIIKNLDKTLKKGKLFFGEELTKFEKNFLNKNNSKYGVAVGSGTDAIYLSLKALNIGYNDEVITVANTAIPTASAIVNTGASIKFADIGQDYLIDSDKLEKLITRKTKAIIVVHLYGQSCNMDKILTIAKKNKIYLIEDCAQAQGAKFKNKKVGNFGIFGCFSFYPTKILGSYGDGGFITTNNKKLFEKIKRLRFYGIETHDKSKSKYDKYFAIENGTNSRLSEIQATILNIKIKYLSSFITKRRKIARIYDKKITNKHVVKPIVNKNNFHVYHLYVLASKKREQIMDLMKKNDIKLTIQYPFPLHKMTAYKKFKKLNLKNTEKFSKEIFSLPIYPNLEINKIKKIINIINTV